MYDPISYFNLVFWYMAPSLALDLYMIHPHPPRHTQSHHPLHRRRNTRSDILPILLRAEPSQGLPIKHHQQKRPRRRQRHHSDGDKALDQPLLRNPRTDRVAEREPDRVPDDDHRDQRLAAQLLEAVDVVAQRRGAAAHDAERQHGGPDDRAHEVHAVRGADAPQHQPRRRDEPRERKVPQPVLGLAHAAVAPREPDREDVAELARPQARQPRADERRRVGRADEP